MKKTIPSVLARAAFLALVLALAFSSCDSPASKGKSDEGGSLSLSASLSGVSAQRLASASAPVRTTFPVGVDFSSIVYSLQLTNSSPYSPISGGTSATGSFATIADIPPGDWTATVTAVDTASGATVGLGSATISISSGATTTATVDLAPPSAGSGTLSLGADWPYLAIPAIAITPLDPPGTATTRAPGTSVTSYTEGFTLPAGAYRIELSLSTDGSVATTQTTVREIVYILPGLTTDYHYSGSASSWKGGAPAIPVLNLTTGNNETYATYALVSWTGAAGAASYDVERSADGGASYAVIASALGPTVSGYHDTSSLNNRIRYRYRVTARNGPDFSQAWIDATMVTLNLTTSVGGTVTVIATGTTSGSFLINTPATISITSPTSTFTSWAVTSASGSATVNAPASFLTSVFLGSNATVNAQ